MKRIIVLVCIALLALSACSDESDAVHALTSAGYTNIQTKGYAGPFACSKDNFYSTSFTATNPAGMIVDGVVCSGLAFKASTIRF